MRKAPRQARSKSTVDAIVEAAARILATGGATGFSTNQVAQAAGVGIGSLYQYFPDKHDIVEAIRRQHLDEVLTALRTASACRGAPRTCAETLVDGLVAVHAGKPGLHRALLELAPAHAAGAQAADGFEQAYADAYVEVEGAAGAAVCNAGAGHGTGAVGRRGRRDSRSGPRRAGRFTRVSPATRRAGHGLPGARTETGYALSTFLIGGFTSER